MESALLEFVHAVVAADIDDVARRLAASPALARASFDVGASRQNASAFFLPEISHYVYGGDTALHLAAAAFRRDAAELLMAHGADCRANNRRGAQPLHYAADANHWNPTPQGDVIRYLVSLGADANVWDGSGAAPLHRAVRTRCLSAVRALIEAGADSTRRNKSGSTPLHLAVQNTGRGGSGSQQAHHEQAGIVRYLLEHGARATDRDGRGRAVVQAATSEWIRVLLTEAG